MQAAEIMTRDVIAVSPQTQVREIVELMMKNRISAVPVVDANQRVLGIVSEGDLMRRVENQTETRHSWWLKSLFSGENDAAVYIKSHGKKAEDIMSADPVTISEETPLHEIAQTLEKHHIKRMPVVRDGRLVGIVSRANLLQGFSVGYTEESVAGSSDDQVIRDKILKELTDNVKISGTTINVVVCDGIAHLWGMVESGTEKRAAQVAAESVPGVKTVKNELGISPPVIGPY